MKKLFIIAGEPSGDLHAAKVIRELNGLNSDIVWRGIGGDQMQSEGVNLVKHMKEMAFMGVVEVLKHLPQIRRNFKLVHHEILSFKPDAVIFIDYPGFNLKIASFAKKNGFKTVYYITPKLWAWNHKRVYKMKATIDHIINIFPFEVDFYKRFGVDSVYFGHPITEGLELKINKASFLNRIGTDKLIGLLPGSRVSEVSSLLPDMFDVVRFYKKKGYKAVIGKVNHIDSEYYRIPDDLVDTVTVLENETYEIMAHSSFLIVASGTANLEAACFHTPMVVVYKVAALTYFLAKRFVKIPHVSPVNIVYQGEAVKELIQENCTSKNIIQEAEIILNYYSNKQDILKEVHAGLDQKDVSKNVAKYIQCNV